MYHYHISTPDILEAGTGEILAHRTLPPYNKRFGVRAVKWMDREASSSTRFVTSHELKLEKPGPYFKRFSPSWSTWLTSISSHPRIKAQFH
ncbi:hypothetical protein Ahy_A07g034392 isoform B [Arachis hypogaea]|uniref:Uncharacterized protein n=1 Tax=Arachis hypogaea TaxID=3818 RepID=A0A445CBY8_ARAHY|nr:hypothetical protein Ahy_A07g034392 isoform B [Arachis hypogaea]